MTAPKDGDTRSCGSMELTLHPEARLVTLRFSADTVLTGPQGAALVDALESVLGEPGERFGLLADAAGVRGVGADYRRVTGAFFGRHRAAARIALVNLGPVIHVIAEMFRVGVDLHLRTFADDDAARAWLRAQGVRA
jgi:SpoIIAA-like